MNDQKPGQKDPQRFNQTFQSKTGQQVTDDTHKNISDEFDAIRQDAQQEKEKQLENQKKGKVNDQEDVAKKNKGPLSHFKSILPWNKKKAQAEEDKEIEINTDVDLNTDIEGLSVKDIIAPIDIEVDFNILEIGDWYYQTFFVSGYPRFVGPNWLSPIINFEHSLRISSFYYPVDSKVVLQKLKRKIGEMEATLYSQVEGRKAIDPAIKVALADAQKLQDSIAEGTEKYFHFAMYITIQAKDKEQLEKIARNVTSTLASISVQAKKATLQQEPGFISTQPLGQDKLYITRNMDTTSLATTFPFVTSELTMDHGIMYGINQHNKSLVVFDRFEMENANSVVFATSGAGKSYFVKLEAIRSMMLGTEVIVIDPEKEYQQICEAVDGAYISFSQDKGDKMNPFELSGVSDEDDDELRMKMLTLQGFFKIMMGELTPTELAILDRALILTYREKGITLDPATQKNADYPLLEDLYKVLKGMAEKEARSLSSRLERYIIGSAAGVFNEASSIELNNPFTVFSIRDMPEELRPLVMYLMLDYIWTKIRKDRKRRILIVDEAWYMMQNEDSAKFLYGMAKRARKYYLGLTTITQDVDDFIKDDKGKAIVTNSSIQFLMKQSPSSVDRLQKVFNLSDGEKQFLLSCDQGQGLFFAGANHVGIQVVSSQAEHEVITSDPKDLDELKRLRETGELQDRGIEELSEMYAPPSVRNPIKDGVNTNERNRIEQAVDNRKDQIQKIMEEKLEYAQKQVENSEGLSPNGGNQASDYKSLGNHIQDQRANRDKGDGNSHLSPSGVVDDNDEAN